MSGRATAGTCVRQGTSEASGRIQIQMFSIRRFAWRLSTLAVVDFAMIMGSITGNLDSHELGCGASILDASLVYVPDGFMQLRLQTHG